MLIKTSITLVMNFRKYKNYSQMYLLEVYRETMTRFKFVVKHNDKRSSENSQYV